MLPLVKDFINALTEYFLPLTGFFAIDGISRSEISQFAKSLMVQANNGVNSLPKLQSFHKKSSTV